MKQAFMAGLSCIECQRPMVVARGYCQTCYVRLRNRGMLPSLTPMERLLTHLSGTDPLGCWVHDRPNAAGYASLLAEGRNWLAHRWMYDQLRGGLDEALVIDHLCRNRACCNPWHMDQVTIGVNAQRGDSPAMNAWRTNTCQRGHDMSKAHVQPSGKRRCRECEAILRAQKVKVLQ
jgi:HNH endonuclease